MGRLRSILTLLAVVIQLWPISVMASPFRLFTLPTDDQIESRNIGYNIATGSSGNDDLKNRIMKLLSNMDVPEDKETLIQGQLDPGDQSNYDHLGTSDPPVQQRARTGRRNDKYLSLWDKENLQGSSKFDHQSLETKLGNHKGRFHAKKPTTNRRKAGRPSLKNSPITYIRLPPSPYQYTFGEAHTSATSHQTFNPFSFFQGIVESRSSPDSDKGALLDPADVPERQRTTGGGKPFSMWSSSKNMGQAKSAQKKLMEKSEASLLNNEVDDGPTSLFMDKAVKRKKPSTLIHRPDIKYLSNARPFGVYNPDFGKTSLFTPSSTTTTTTTTTTTATTTTTSTSTSTTTTASTTASPEGFFGKDSPIIWLGKFIFNGLPSKLFEFKSPFSPLSLFSSMQEVSNSAVQSDYTSSSFMPRLF